MSLAINTKDIGKWSDNKEQKPEWPEVVGTQEKVQFNESQDVGFYVSSE